MSRFLARTSFSILPGALLAALLVNAACGNSKAAKAGAPPAMPVKVQTAKAQKIDDTTDYVATLKSRDSAVVMPQVEGIITQIFVHSGERVATVDPPCSREAYSYIPIEKSAQLKMTLPVQIGDASGAPLAASRITFISPQVDTATQTVLAKAQI